MASRRQDSAEHTEPHLISRTVATVPAPGGGAEPYVVSVTTEAHYDVYEEELGNGTQVYDAWAIEDDATGANPDAKYENLGRAAEASAEGRGFRTPAGRPSSNELWRFRVRGCQDCWAALFFFALLFVVILWGASELHHFSLTPEMVDTIRVNMGLGKAAEDEGGLGVDASKTVAVPASEDVVAPLPAALETVTPSPASKEKEKAREKGKGKSSSTETTKDATIVNVAFSGWSLRRIIWVLTWSAVSVAVACFGLSLFRYMPRFLIVMECWVEFALFASVGLVTCLSGNLFGAVLFGVLAAFPLLWLYLVQDRIPFAVCLLKIASRVVQRHMGLVVVSIVTAMVLVLYAMLTICFMVPPILRAAAESSASSDASYLFVLLFTLLWVEQVLVNLMHVTASGVVATWYFAGESHMPDGPVHASFKRATTSSLGSICFGSLFVAIVRFLRFVANASRGVDGDDGGFCGCVCDCFLSLLEGLLQYFNIYAFVHVAIYGCSYVDAARRTWALTQKCFFAAVFNDCLAYQAVDVLGLMLAVVVAVIGGLLCNSFALGLTIFFISFFVNSIVFQLVQSTVTTIFVCFAEVPEGMELSFPELYEEMMAMDAKITGGGVHHQNYGTM